MVGVAHPGAATGAELVELRASEMGANKRHNQDWSGIARLPLAGRGETATLLAVADGHGSKEYVRSDLGARFAVAAFQRTAARFFAGAEPQSWHTRRSQARHDFPRALALQWRRLVVLHATNNPPRGALPDAADDQRAASIDTLRLYGSTLIAALVAPGLFAAWQIGDGELFLVDEERRNRLPLAKPGADLGDETDSLCHHDAADRFESVWWPDRRPALVSLSTDGLSKSFADQEGFHAFCIGLFDRLERGDRAAVAESLPAWLARAAAHSGDDSTLCALYDPTPVHA